MSLFQSSEGRVIEPIAIEDGQLGYLAEFMNPDSQMQMFERLSQTLAWQQDNIKIFGRSVAIPRLQAWYGDKQAQYRYSGILMTPHDWTDELKALQLQISQLCHSPFNSVMANFYRDGLDKMGYHSDNEKELGDEPTIVSFNLGATRKFVLKHQHTGQKIELLLPGGSLLVMAGKVQQYYKHAVPQQKRVTDGRINLTFRYTHPL